MGKITWELLPPDDKIFKEGVTFSTPLNGVWRTSSNKPNESTDGPTTEQPTTPGEQSSGTTLDLEEMAVQLREQLDLDEMEAQAMVLYFLKFVVPLNLKFQSTSDAVSYLKELVEEEVVSPKGVVKFLEGDMED